jgi:hypothetical protein
VSACKPSTVTHAYTEHPPPEGDVHSLRARTTLTAVKRRVVGAFSCSLVIVATGCGAFDTADKSQVPGRAAAAAPAQQAAAPAPTTGVPAPTTTGSPPTAPPTTVAPTTAAPTTAAPTTAATTTTTTTIPLPPGIHDPACAKVVQPGDSLSLIADAFDDPTVTAESLRTENAVANVDVIHAGDVLDVCPGNRIDDLTGEERGVAASAVGSSGVAAQQEKLNELFAGYGLPALAVDGVSGPFTRQQLCAARMALHLPISRADMVPGSAEEQALMSAQSIAIPQNAAVGSSRWILINKTCQVMFAGEGDSGVTFVFKTSTGEPGWETSNQESVRAFRYDPALENDGWHNSTKFPAEEDNPLNGNMYRPLYFHRGQAIHGANNVPPEPASKGCARLRTENQDALLSWLGLDDVSSPTYDDDRINVMVSVHGEYEPG